MDDCGELLLDESESEWSPAWGWSDEPGRKKGHRGERLEAVVPSSLDGWPPALCWVAMVTDGSRDNTSCQALRTPHVILT